MCVPAYRCIHPYIHPSIHPLQTLPYVLCTHICTYVHICRYACKNSLNEVVRYRTWAETGYQQVGPRLLLPRTTCLWASWRSFRFGVMPGSGSLVFQTVFAQGS